jgi:hypothetical protein
MSDTAAELARYAAYARACNEALPIDEDAERIVARLLNARPPGYVKRKLLPRAKP